jgi:hypothetical protein
MRRRAPWIVGQLVVVTAISALASSCSDDPDPGRTVSVRANAPAVPGQVDGPRELEHCGGERTTLKAELIQSRPDFGLYLPDHPLAHDGSMTAIYRCHDTGMQAEYASGISVYMGSTDIADPGQAWEDLAATEPEIYSVTKVLGVPAWVSDASKDPSGVAEGGVVAVLQDGTYVAVIGDGTIVAEDLVAVTGSLTLRGASSSG